MEWIGSGGGYRELAMQIAEQFLVLGAPLSVRVAVIIGGLGTRLLLLLLLLLELLLLPSSIPREQSLIIIHLPAPDWIGLDWIDMMKQAAELERKPHVIIATPGRLQDHLRSASAPGLHRLRFLVRRIIRSIDANIIDNNANTNRSNGCACRSWMRRIDCSSRVASVPR